MFKAVMNSLSSIAFPQNCHCCNSPVKSLSDGVACAKCWAETRIFSDKDRLCPKCGNVLVASLSENAEACRSCSGHYYDRSAAAGVYSNALAAVILELKKSPHLPGRAKDLLFTALERSGFGDADLIMPVPLSAKRRVERGFNQAEVISDLLSVRARIPADDHSLVRRIHTPIHRAGMDRKARETTVKNAFQVRRPKLVEGRSILLVDDIFTSGATASYCAKALKENGSVSVNVLTLARAVQMY